MTICPNCKKDFKNLGSHKRFCKPQESSILDALKPLEDELKNHRAPEYLIDKQVKVPEETNHKEGSKEEIKVLPEPEVKPKELIVPPPASAIQQLPPPTICLDAWEYLAKPRQPKVVPTKPKYENLHNELTLPQMVEISRKVPPPEIVSSEVPEVKPTIKKKKMPRWFAYMILVWILILIYYLLTKVI